MKNIADLTTTVFIGRQRSQFPLEVEAPLAHESIFYGLIDAGEIKGRGQLIHAHNRRIIESLPDSPSKFISRQMFAFVEPPVAFRTQLIHFARSINYIEDCWPRFLSDFEALIARMCWDSVHLHISFDNLAENTLIRGRPTKLARLIYLLIRRDRSVHGDSPVARENFR